MRENQRAEVAERLLADWRTIKPNQYHEGPMDTQPTRMAHIHNIRSLHVEGTQSADEVIEAMRSSTHSGRWRSRPGEPIRPEDSLTSLSAE